MIKKWRTNAPQVLIKKYAPDTHFPIVATINFVLFVVEAKRYKESFLSKWKKFMQVALTPKSICWEAIKMLGVSSK
jgi:hypothetical protein